MTCRIPVAPGDGIALVHGDVAAIIAAPDQHASGTTQLIDLLRSQEGEMLVRSAALLVMHEDDLPDFGILVGPLENATVFLHGDISFHAVIDGMDTSGRGSGAREWVERSLPGVAEWIGIGAQPHLLPDSSWWDLREGATPASTVWLVAAATAGESSGDTTAAPGVEFVDLSGAHTHLPGDPLPPVTSAPRTEDDPDDGAPVAIVRGVRCPDNHHNNPKASFCSMCGRRMGVSRSLVLVDGPRPPLGVLVVDDGATIPVRSDMVLGRSPADHPLVLEGRAQPVALQDPSMSMSRAHIHVRLDEWDIVVEDLGSSNGTFVWDATAGEWLPLTPGNPRVIEGRQVIRMGDREMHFAPHHVAS